MLGCCVGWVWLLEHLWNICDLFLLIFRVLGRLGLHRGLHRAPQETLGNPGFWDYFQGFLKCFLDFWSNIKVFGENNVIFELLQQKACRIIYKFRPKTLFWTRSVRNWTKSRKSDMSGPAKASPGGQVLVSKAGFPFFSFRNYTFPICISTFIIL